MKKISILVVHIGTTVVQTIHEELEPLAKRIAETFTEADVVLTFTSERSIRKLASKNYDMPSVYSELERKLACGYEKIIVLPLHLLNSPDFLNLEAYIHKLLDKDRVQLIRPLINDITDCQEMATLLTEILKGIMTSDGTLLVGHGMKSEAQDWYGRLDTRLRGEAANTFLTTLEDDFEAVVEQLRTSGLTSLKLFPLFTVAGYHVNQDLLSKEDSMLNRLEKEGFKMTGYSKGLITYEPIIKLLLGRIHEER
jgi:cobalamin biosynthesis Co2+ chelatase CbiK